jgi:hypothetical protein
MEHEFFHSKLKPSVDGVLVSDMIRSSSSGLNSHRTAAIELILERSIEEHRERMFDKAKNNLRRDSTPQPQNPATASQPPSRSLLNDTTGIIPNPASASATHEAAQHSSIPSKLTKKIRGVVLRKEPPADVKTNPSTSEVFVELACQNCQVRRLRSQLPLGLYCSSCPWPCPRMKCVSCGTVMVTNVDACTSCHGKFK